MHAQVSQNGICLVIKNGRAQALQFPAVSKAEFIIAGEKTIRTLISLKRYGSDQIGLVRLAGLEPARLTSTDFKSVVYAIPPQPHKDIITYCI